MPLLSSGEYVIQEPAQDRPELQKLADRICFAANAALSVGQLLEWSASESKCEVRHRACIEVFTHWKAARDLIARGAASGCPAPAGKSVEAWFVELLNDLDEMNCVGGFVQRLDSFEYEYETDSADDDGWICEHGDEADKLNDELQRWRERLPALSDKIGDAIRHLDNVVLLRAGDGTADTGEPLPPRHLPPDDDLNIRARQFLMDNPASGCRAIAAAIGCSAGKVRQLPAYIAVKERREKDRPPAPKAVPLSDELAESIGDRDAELERLIGEQKADDRNDKAPRKRDGKPIGRRRKP
ncbi:MAG TPA: hypothetical protein VF278_05775, partial [Pirellulales bacterium]